MPETRRLCRKCYKRRKLDATGRCRHCNPSGSFNGHDAESVTTSGVVPGTYITTSSPSPGLFPTMSNNSNSNSSQDIPSPPGRAHRPRLLHGMRRYSGGESDNGSVGTLHDSNSTSLSVQVDSRIVQQRQMFADFFQSHLPAASAAEVGRARSISYLANIPFIDLSSPLLSAAVDALCLAHVGSTRQDARLLHASQNSYGTVLASIRRTLTGSMGQTLSSREIVMAIMVISLFDECMPVEHRSSNSSMTHLWGAQQYLTATAPSQFDLNHPIDRTLILNVFQNGFWLALAKRQRVSGERSDWTAVQDKMFPSRMPYTILAQLPSMLEQTDNLLNQEVPDLTALTLLCGQLDNVRYNIYKRMQKDNSAIQPELVHFSDISAFDMDIEEHSFITTSSVFPSQYRFSNPEPAVNWACRAVIFLVIDCTLLRIFHFRPAARNFPSRRTPFEVEQDATTRAAQLCQSVYHFSQLRSLAYVDFLIMFMELAHNFYQEQNSWREMTWCQSCLVASQTRLKRLRVHRPPTLCRLGDLPAGIKAAGRYKSPQLSVSESKAPDSRPDLCPRAIMSQDSCPMGGVTDSYAEMSIAPSMSSSSTTASSVSPALSMVVPRNEELHGDSKEDDWIFR